MQRDGSSVRFPLGSRRISGLATLDPLAQMNKLALLLLQLPSHQLNCVSSTLDKWPQNWLYPRVPLLILQQPIRARLLWWLLKLSFKIGRPHCSCFPAAMTSLFSYLFNPVCIFFLLCLSSPETYNKKILYMNIKLWLKLKDSDLKLKYAFNFFEI